MGFNSGFKGLIKANEMDSFSNLFDKILYMFRDRSAVHRQEYLEHCMHTIVICNASSVGCC